MSNIQTIKINETTKLAEAIRKGRPFYISDKGARVLAYNPELELAENELFTLLQEAEDCKEYCSIDECVEYIKSV